MSNEPSSATNSLPILIAYRRATILVMFATAFSSACVGFLLFLLVTSKSGALLSGKSVLLLVGIGCGVFGLHKTILVFHLAVVKRGEGIFLRAGRIVYLSERVQSFPVDEIVAVDLGPFRVWGAEMECLVFSLKGDRKEYVFYALLEGKPADIVSRIRTSLGVTGSIERVT